GRARVRVFVSSCKGDRGALEKLVEHLSPLVRAEAIRLWHGDSDLAGAVVGESRASEIEAAQLAVLLVSAKFLADDECMKDVLPRLLARKGLRIVPVIVSPCLVASVPDLERL